MDPWVGCRGKQPSPSGDPQWTVICWICWSACSSSCPASRTLHLGCWLDLLQCNPDPVGGDRQLFVSRCFLSHLWDRKPFGLLTLALVVSYGKEEIMKKTELRWSVMPKHPNKEVMLNCGTMRDRNRKPWESIKWQPPSHGFSFSKDWLHDHQFAQKNATVNS